MPSWNNNQFRAWIAIEGEEAEEYDVQTSEEDKTVTCWIASELGKRFSVHWENSSLVGNTAGHVYMDGIGCAGHMIRENAPLPAIRMTDSTTDGTVKKRFMFSTLELTDDDAVLETASNIDLGVISLQIYPIHIGPPIETQMSTLPETKLHERSKKAVTQQIKLGEAEILPTAIPVFRFTRAGPDIVIFKFKYRSADVLRANGIAPPLKRKAPESSGSPEPTPLLNDDEDEREVKRLRAQLEAAEAKMASKNKPRIKAESTPDIDLTQPRKKVKREAGASSIPSSKAKEVIDLTLGDVDDVEGIC